MVGNPICKQIPWENNPEHFAAWKEVFGFYQIIILYELMLF